jgi:hypothetical protein
VARKKIKIHRKKKKLKYIYMNNYKVFQIKYNKNQPTRVVTSFNKAMPWQIQAIEALDPQQLREVVTTNAGITYRVQGERETYVMAKTKKKNQNRAKGLTVNNVNQLQAKKSLAKTKNQVKSAKNAPMNAYNTPRNLSNLEKALVMSYLSTNRELPFVIPYAGYGSILNASNHELVFMNSSGNLYKIFKKPKSSGSSSGSSSNNTPPAFSSVGLNFNKLNYVKYSNIDKKMLIVKFAKELTKKDESVSINTNTSYKDLLPLYKKLLTKYHPNKIQNNLNKNGTIVKKISAAFDYLKKKAQTP